MVKITCQFKGDNGQCNKPAELMVRIPIPFTNTWEYLFFCKKHGDRFFNVAITDGFYFEAWRV